MYPPIEPFDSGLLPRPDGAQIYWEESGDPDGLPGLYLHGGPGGELGAGGYRRRFDPDRYRIIGLDQRGCGRSQPLAGDHPETLAGNTTQALIADIEALREHLAVAAWVVHGVSWGSTLALAYALAHPDRVRGLVLTAVTTGDREEIDWITCGVGRIFPEAWEIFSQAVRAHDGERVLEAYARTLRSAPLPERVQAARAWNAWEAAHVSLDPAVQAGDSSATAASRADGLTFATLVTHYWAHDCFLRGPERILPRAGELAGIPGWLIHGRHDISGPVITPWRLHRAWRGSRLEVVESEGHGGAVEMELTRRALDALASPD